MLDNKFVAVLSMASNTAADILVCFDIKNALTTNESIQLRLITEVTRCHKFFFTLLSNGTVCILCILLKSMSVSERHLPDSVYFGLM